MAVPDKLVIQIVERIEDKIALGEYRPGDRLRQEQLAEAFSISRTPVREALRLLEAKGVISQEHRHSAVIRAPSTREVRETYPEMKVIFISGYTEDSFRQHLDSDSNIHFLPKPFSLKQLATKVKEVISGETM